MSLATTVGAYLGLAGNEFVNFDNNPDGIDDFIGEALLFAESAINAVEAGEDLPPFPDALKNGVSGKLTDKQLFGLRLASSAIMLARIQTSGRLSTILRYIGDAFRQLAAGRPVPPAPPGL